MTTGPSPAKHPFLDDLAPDVVLESNVLRRSLSGRDDVLRVVRAVGKMYQTQVPAFHHTVGHRGFLAYDAEIVGGRAVRGVVVIERNPDESVAHLTINFGPLDGMMSIAVRLGETLEAEYGRDLLL